MPHNPRDRVHRRVPNFVTTKYLQSFAAPLALGLEEWMMDGCGTTAYSTSFLVEQSDRLSAETYFSQYFKKYTNT